MATKANDQLKRIPVLVLTIPYAEEDVFAGLLHDLSERGQFRRQLPVGQRFAIEVAILPLLPAPLDTDLLLSVPVPTADTDAHVPSRHLCPTPIRGLTEPATWLAFLRGGWLAAR